MGKEHDGESLRLLIERLAINSIAALVATGETLDLASLDAAVLLDLLHDIARRSSKRAANVRFEQEMRD